MPRCSGDRARVVARISARRARRSVWGGHKRQATRRDGTTIRPSTRGHLLVPKGTGRLPSRNQWTPAARTNPVPQYVELSPGAHCQPRPPLTLHTHSCTALLPRQPRCVRRSWECCTGPGSTGQAARMANSTWHVLSNALSLSRTAFRRPRPRGIAPKVLRGSSEG